MDSFEDLSPELRIQVLACLHDSTSISSVIKASPCMLKTYLLNKNYIRRQFYEQEFDKFMMQDALAIAQFPVLEAHETLMSPPMKRYGERWLCQGFEYPEGDDSATLASFDKLYRHLRQKTQRKLSKRRHGGTFKLTSISTEDGIKHGVKYTEIKVPYEVSAVNDLSSDVRKQFYRVFLRQKFTETFESCTKSHKECVDFNRMLRKGQKENQE